MHSSYTFKAGAQEALSCFSLLLNYKRLVGFLALPYVVVSPLYIYCFNMGFPFFPLVQAQFLLFHYVANIQTSIQVSIQEYTFFMLPEWLHYLWIPLIFFIFNFVHALFVNYSFQVMRVKHKGNIERAFIVTNGALYPILLWALVSTIIIFPLGILWSFTKQTTLLKEFLLVCHPLFASFLTGPLFSLCIMGCLFLYQSLAYAVIPNVAQGTKSFFVIIRDGCFMVQQLFFFSLGASLALSVVWGCATWTFNPFLSVFVVPIIINAVALLFAMQMHTLFYKNH